MDGSGEFSQGPGHGLNGLQALTEAGHAFPVPFEFPAGQVARAEVQAGYGLARRDKGQVQHPNDARVDAGGVLHLGGRHHLGCAAVQPEHVDQLDSVVSRPTLSGSVSRQPSPSLPAA